MTAASQISALCSGGKVSRRAASTACTVSGIGSSTPSLSRSSPSARTRRSRSRSRRTYSSAYSGFPPARWRTGVLTRSRRCRRGAPDQRLRRRRQGRQGEASDSRARDEDVFPTSEELRPRGRHDQQRDVGFRRRQVPHEVEHGVVGPVQVFEHEHGRPPRGGSRRGTASKRRDSRLARPPTRRDREARAGVAAAGAILPVGQHRLELRLHGRRGVRV